MVTRGLFASLYLTVVDMELHRVLDSMNENKTIQITIE